MTGAAQTAEVSPGPEATVRGKTEGWEVLLGSGQANRSSRALGVPTEKAVLTEACSRTSSLLSPSSAKRGKSPKFLEVRDSILPKPSQAQRKQSKY